MEINTCKKPKNLDEMYSMIVELNNNYKIIKEKNEINKKNILSLNIQFKVLLANFTETKEDLKKNIEELKEKVEKVIKANKKDNNINNISNLNSGFKSNIENLEEKTNSVNTLMKKKFDDLENEIKALKLKLAEKEELKIEDKNGKNNFDNLENKLSMIMAKGEADKNDIEEIKKISKQIIEGTDVSPTEIIMDFFKSNMNNLTTYSIDKTSLQRLVDLKLKICDVISVYEPELKMRIKIEKEKEKNIKGKEKEKEKKNINVIHIIDEFRKEYNLDNHYSLKIH